MRLRVANKRAPACTAVLVVACVACGSGAAKPRATTTPKPVVAAPATTQLAVGFSRFCAAFTALSQGFIPQATAAGVQQAHQKVNALLAAAPAQLRPQVTQMAREYIGVVDAFAAAGFDSQRVLANATPQVKATLERLTAESNPNNPPVEPEGSVVQFATANCH